MGWLRKLATEQWARAAGTEKHARAGGGPDVSNDGISKWVRRGRQCVVADDMPETGPVRHVVTWTASSSMLHVTPPERRRLHKKDAICRYATLQQTDRSLYP